MGKDVIETKEVDYDEILEQAGLEAEADEVASAGREVPEEDMPEEDTDGEDRFKVEFFKEYAFDNGVEIKKIKSIDMSGLLDLTTIDAERFDRILIKTGHRPICTNLVRMLAFVTCPFFVFQQKNPQNTQERHPQKEG